jgi:hypothetical protein
MKLLTILILILTNCSVVPTGVPNEKIAYGTFTYVDEQHAQFKSYDDCINYNKSIYNLIKERNNKKDAGYTNAIDFIDNFNKNDKRR